MLEILLGRHILLSPQALVLLYYADSLICIFYNNLFIYFIDQTERENIPKISEIILTAVKAEIEKEKIKEKENLKEPVIHDNGSNICNGCKVCTGSTNIGDGGGIANDERSHRGACANNLHVDTSIMYEFMLFDKPEIVKDKSGTPKTITNGDECMNLLIPSGRYLDEHSP